MISIPVFNESGQQIGDEQLDEQALGGAVNTQLLKQAVVMYRANQRQSDACQKTRAEVEGSTRKLYRQKGTGRARRGNVRTPVMRGGGRAFPNKPHDNHSQDMPRKMRRLARNNAVLAKIQGGAALIIDGLSFDGPKTKRFAAMLTKLSSNSCVYATNGVDPVAYKSGRNIPKVDILPVAELNAYTILRRTKLIFTRDAFNTFRAGLAGGEK